MTEWPKELYRLRLDGGVGEWQVREDDAGDENWYMPEAEVESVSVFPLQQALEGLRDMARDERYGSAFLGLNAEFLVAKGLDMAAEYLEGLTPPLVARESGKTK